jgi:hypothetical protein
MPGVLRASDYFVIAIGVVGTLSVFGAVTRMPRLVLLTLLVFSSLICCFSLLLLTLKRFIPGVAAHRQKHHRCYVLANLVPAIYSLTRLSESQWRFFIF